MFHTKKIVSLLLDKWYWCLILVIAALAVNIRLRNYADPFLSIATNDSDSYYMNIHINTFSWEALTARRLPTYVGVFKILEPPNGYGMAKTISYPAAPKAGTNIKKLQPGFHRVVWFQMVFSILGWGFLALVAAKNLKKPIAKLLAVFLILAFAITPPIVDWDSVLMAESVSFSLFAIMLGLTIELSARLAKEGRKPSWWTWVVMVFWVVVYVLWAFARDSNANMLIMPLLACAFLLIVPRIRRKVPVWPLAAAGVLFTTLFALYFAAAMASHRWWQSFVDIYADYLSPYPDRMEYFRAKGMPEHGYQQWAMQHGAVTYLEFLFDHPGITTQLLFYRMEDVFSENIQPYYFTQRNTSRKFLESAGNIMHPLSSGVFMLALLGSCGTMFAAFGKGRGDERKWGWTAAWLLVLIFGLYGASFYADSAGIIRHVLGAVMPMRLMIWLFPVVLCDLALSRLEPSEKENGLV